MTDVTPPLLGPEVPVESDSPCPTCGAGNPPAADFCWQCYASLRGAATPAGYQGPRGRPGRQLGSSEPFPAPSLPAPETPRHGTGRVRAISLLMSALVAAAAGVFLFDRLGASDPVLPDAVAGVPVLDAPALDEAMDAFREQMDTAGIDGDMAFYGSGTPQYVLAWFRDPAETDPELALSEFASGFASTSGASIETSSLETKSADGTEYLCAPIAGQFSAAVCMWTEDEIYWFVFNLQPGLGLSATQDLAVQAHDATST